MRGGFAARMTGRRKLGGQNKLPRIVNDPDLIAALQSFAEPYGEAGDAAPNVISTGADRREA